MSYSNLSRRERQIMEFLYKTQRASVAEILKGIPNPPGYSAVRATVNILERKGHLSHVLEGKKYLYSPVAPRRQAMRGAVRQLLSTYFDNSVEKAVTALVALHGKDLRAADIERLEKLIRRKKREAPS
jgi:BlaI family penicillinase repressor